MASDSLLLNLLVKEEARINELEAQLESERVLSSQIIEELTKEVEFLRVSNCPPPRENQSTAHVDDNLSTFSIIQQLAKEKDELAGQLETAKKQNIELGAVLTQQQAILVGVTTKNNDLQAELSKEIESKKNFKEELLKTLDSIKECFEDDEEEDETEFEEMVGRKDEIISELEKKLAEAQEKIKELECKCLELTKEAVAEEAKNEEPAPSETDLKEAEIKKAKKEDYVNKLVHQFMFHFAPHIQMRENEPPLEEYVRKMAGKEFDHKEQDEELSSWRYRMCERLRASKTAAPTQATILP